MSECILKCIYTYIKEQSLEVADNDKSHSVPSCVWRRPVNSDSVEVTVSCACMQKSLDQQIFELCANYEYDGYMHNVCNVTCMHTFIIMHYYNKIIMSSY